MLTFIYNTLSIPKIGHPSYPCFSKKAVSYTQLSDISVVIEALGKTDLLYIYMWH